MITHYPINSSDSFTNQLSSHPHSPWSGPSNRAWYDMKLFFPAHVAASCFLLVLATATRPVLVWEWGFCRFGLGFLELSWAKRQERRPVSNTRLEHTELGPLSGQRGKRMLPSQGIIAHWLFNTTATRSCWKN